MSRAAAPRLRETLRIEWLGQRGEGVAQGPDGPIYIPYALPGDTVTADVAGDRGRCVEMVAAAPGRIAPFCPYFGTCGGCAVQALAPVPYARWKHALVAAPLARAGIGMAVSPLVDAHGEGRRRATFHARVDGTAVRVGFMRARTHDIIEIEQCPVLTPEMAGALPAARSIARVLADRGKPLDIVATATLSGLDLDVRGCGDLPEAHRQALIGLADRLDLARIANHGRIVVERRPPLLRMGRANVVPPPGAFVQATQAGEDSLAGLVADAVAGAARVADLFSGVGTFALRLAETAELLAVELDQAALAALAKAARGAVGLRPVTVEARNLFTRPLTRAECDRFDALVLDPPRAGAEAQARELASAKTPTVVAVSCDAASFARDAAILVGGGYAVERVTPLDQFRHSPHVEIVGVFRRGKPARRRRSLLG